MFSDESAILQAAATLAAAQHEVHANQGPSGSKAYTDSCVDVLINVLREMESKKLIGPGLAPRL